MALRLTGAAAVPSRLAVARQPGHGGSLVGDVAGLGGRLGRYLLGSNSRWTGDRRPGVSPQPLPGPEGLFDELRAFDPRTRGGLVNLATMFVPGSKGGRLPAWQLKMPEAELGATLEKAGIQPSYQGGEIPVGGARDPDSAALLGERVAAAGRSPFLRLPEYTARAIGPRQVGGVYRSGYSGETYRVLEIAPGYHAHWRIKVETISDPHAPYSTGPRWHATAWDPKHDRVVSQPEWSAGVARNVLGGYLRQPYHPGLHRPK